MFATVILDQSIGKALDYSVPENLSPKIRKGVRVLVPLRGTLKKGTILSLKNSSAIPSVQPISKVISEEESFIPDDLLELASWMEKYYATDPSSVLRTILPPGLRNEIRPKKTLFVRSLVTLKEMAALSSGYKIKAPEQAEVLDLLLENPQGLWLSDLLSEGKFSRSPVDTLVKKKIIEAILLPSFSALEHEFFQGSPKTLTSEQTIALERIGTSLEKKQFQTHLLYGVTGSGKTEVYLQAIEKTLQKGKGTILLVPEIALTAQTVERLKSRFQKKIAILHCRMSDGERWEAWHAIRKKEILIAVGARSAIFSPVADLGLIIVDEEHESSYKQSEEAPCYHARDVAVMRGKLAHAPVVLGSATPSMESYHNAEKGKYLLSRLTVRASDASLPSITLVDMKPEFAKTKGYCLFSDLLLEEIKKRYAVGEQVILFLNRRGFHAVQLCTACSKTVRCIHCDASLTHHLGDGRLACHLCGYVLSPPPRKCPSCQSEESLKFRGAGTEQVERSLHALFPSIRTLRMDADTTRRKGSHETLFRQFRSGKADILIGTQMITKGLHFPSVTLVGVLNSDAALNFPDFRASETLFQLLTQVSGRAGRGAIPGQVIIQTLLPNHPIFTYAQSQDYSGFYEEEIRLRKMFFYPPFSHLIRFLFSGSSSEKTFDTASRYHSALIRLLPPSFQFHPPIPSGHAKIRDQFRYHFLLKTEKMIHLTPLLQKVRTLIPPEKDVRILIEVDPLSTFL